MIVVIDYKVGNVKSVCRAFEHLGFDAELSKQVEKIESADGLVLPGVAAFGFAVNALGDLAGVIAEQVRKGVPLLGICVGFQLLFEESCEHGRHRGLGLINGNIAPIPPGRVIPHMGWNQVEINEEIELFDGFDSDKFFYFAHSYCAEIDDRETRVAYTNYGFRLSAAVQKNNIFGTQFHPEKSGPNGLRILENFVSVCRKDKQDVS